MTKKEFAKELFKNSGLTTVTEAERVTEAFIQTVKEQVAKGNTLFFRDFGIFSIRTSSRKEGRNPRTGEPVKMTPKKFIKFKVGKDLEDRLNSPSKRGRKKTK